MRCCSVAEWEFHMQSTKKDLAPSPPPLLLPRPEFALAKIGRWSLYRLTNGRLVAYRKGFSTTRGGELFMRPDLFIDWPSSIGDIPESTRLEFAAVVTEMRAGL